tara:strand:- start:507 stop:683 length:177 start_codon:yes stop_codon:yes gene_type:complete
MINKDIIINLTDIEISCLEISIGNYGNAQECKEELERIANLCIDLRIAIRDRIDEANK